MVSRAPLGQTQKSSCMVGSCRNDEMNTIFHIPHHFRSEPVIYKRITLCVLICAVRFMDWHWEDSWGLIKTLIDNDPVAVLNMEH